MIFVMRHGVLKILMIMVMVLSMASVVACAVLSPSPGIKPCHKSLSLKHGISKVTTGTCHVQLCHVQNGRVFLLPEAPTRRHETDLRYNYPLPDESIVTTDMLALFSVQKGNAMLKLPAFYIPPPVIVLFCTLIC